MTMTKGETMDEGNWGMRKSGGLILYGTVRGRSITEKGAFEDRLEREQFVSHVT